MQHYIDNALYVLENMGIDVKRLVKMKLDYLNLVDLIIFRQKQINKAMLVLSQVKKGV